MDSVAQLMERGTSYYGSSLYRPTAPTGSATSPYGTSVALEGTEKEFRDIDPTARVAPGINILRSDRMVVCRFVRNVSGVQLQPGMAVKWAAGYRGKRVDGYLNPSAIGGQEAAGIVDEFFPATGVPDDDCFWLVTKGPCLVRAPVGGDTWAEGDDLFAASATSSQEDFLASASSGATSAAPDDEGRLTPLVASYNATQQSDGTVVNVALNRVAVAMSACSTSNADKAAWKLVDVCLR